MGNFQEAVTVYSNFITPPDFIDESKHTVLLIDASENIVRELALWCKEQATMDFNVYLYNYTMDDIGWLFEAVTRSDAVIIIGKSTELSAVKNQISRMSKSYIVGTSESPEKSLNQVLDYFVKYQGTVK